MATLVEIITYVMNNKHEIKAIKDPFHLGGEPAGMTKEERAAMSDIKMPGYSTTLQAWTCPFIMAGCNTRVVRRSMAGLNCEYKEVTCFGGSMALVNATVTWFFMTLF